MKSRDASLTSHQGTSTSTSASLSKTSRLLRLPTTTVRSSFRRPRASHASSGSRASRHRPMKKEPTQTSHTLASTSRRSSMKVPHYRLLSLSLATTPQRLASIRIKQSTRPAAPRTSSTALSPTSVWSLFAQTPRSPTGIGEASCCLGCPAASMRGVQCTSVPLTSRWL